MISLRKLVGFLMAVMLATFAGHSMAAGGKQFYAQFPASIPSTASTITVTFCNSSPGPSTINSFQIVAPPGALLTITNVLPGSASVSGDGQSAIVNGVPGIKKGECKDFAVSVKDITATCHRGDWDVAANAGNAFPQGDVFAKDLSIANPPRMKLTSTIGCDFAGFVTCGDSVGYTPPQVIDPNQPGYANFKVKNLKDGGSCGTTTYGISGTNTLTIDNKLVVALSDVNAAFEANIVSPALPLVDGYASLRVKVAWKQNTDGSWQYFPARTCTCSTASSLSCMPTGAVSTDPYDGTLGNEVRTCVADYSWVVTSPGFAKYFATIFGFGGDPAMGWQ